jgi:hypothetical protein
VTLFLRSAVLIPAALFFSVHAVSEDAAQTPVVKPVFQYREITGKETYLSTTLVDTLRNHLHVHNEDRTSVDDYLIDTATDQCVRWIYQPRNGSIRLLVVRDNQLLRLSGTHRNGKDFQRTVKLGSAPWAQEWMSFLGAFALSGRPSATFCSLVPPTFDCATFCGRVIGEESIIIDGAMVPAVHVRASFNGTMRVAWHGDYWFRSRDGRFVRFAGSILPGLPASVFELVENGPAPRPTHQKKRTK